MYSLLIDPVYDKHDINCNSRFENKCPKAPLPHPNPRKGRGPQTKKPIGNKFGLRNHIRDIKVFDLIFDLMEILGQLIDFTAQRNHNSSWE